MFRRTRIAGQLLAISIIAGSPLGALAQAPEALRCDRLVAFYDRYAGDVSEGRAQPPGHLERELGVQECRNGNHAAGVRLLEEAIRKIGYKVPTG